MLLQLTVVFNVGVSANKLECSRVWLIFKPSLTIRDNLGAYLNEATCGMLQALPAKTSLC